MAKVGAAEIDVFLNDLMYKLGLDGLERSTQKTLDKIGKGFQSVGAKLSLFVTAPLTALAGVGIRSAMQLETFAASLNVLIGDAERANMVFDQLYEFSADVPFDWRSLTEATRVLAAFGVEAEDVIDTLSMIGDVAAGVQMPIQDLAEIYGRVLTTGRISSLEVNALARQGIPIYTELAEVLGVSTAEVRELVSTGTVGFPQMQRVFMNLTSEGGKFFQMMDAQSQTVEGRLNRLKDTFEQVTDAIGIRLLPTFDKLISMGQSASEWFVNLDESTQGLIITFGGAAAAAGPLLLALGGIIRLLPTLMAGITALRTIGLLSFGPVGWIAAGVTTVLGLSIALGGTGSGQLSLAAAIERVDTTISSSDALNNFEEVFTKLADTLTGPVKTAFNSAKDDIWGIVSAAEDAREALAAIQLGAQLSSKFWDNNRIQSLIPINLDGPEFHAGGIISRALMRGDFETALVQLDEIIEGARELDQMMNQNTGGRGSSAGILGPILLFRDDVAAAQTELDALFAKLDRPDLDTGDLGLTGVTQKIRTLSDVLSDLDKAGTFEMRWAAFQGGGPEEALTAAQNRMQLIEGALQEIIRDFYSEVTEETLNDLRARYDAAVREMYGIMASMALPSDIAALLDGPGAGEVAKAGEIESNLEKLVALSQRVETLTKRYKPMSELELLIQEIQVFSQVQDLPPGIRRALEDMLGDLTAFQTRLEEIALSKALGPMQRLLDPLEDLNTGAIEEANRNFNRSQQLLGQVGSAASRANQILGKTPDQLSELIRELELLAGVSDLDPLSLREIQRLLTSLKAFQGFQASQAGVTPWWAGGSIGAIPDLSPGDADAVLAGLEFAQGLFDQVSTLADRADSILGRGETGLQGVIRELELLSQVSGIDPLALQEIQRLLTSLKTFQAFQGQGALPSGASDIAGVTDEIMAADYAAGQLGEGLTLAEEGFARWLALTDQASTIMGTAPTEVESLISSLEGLRSIPLLSRLIGDGIDDLIADLTGWQETQDTLAGQTEVFSSLEKQLNKVSNESDILAGAMEPVVEQLQALLLTVSDPELLAKIAEALQTAEELTATAIQNAADRFSQTVVDAGFRVGESIIKSLKDGNLTGVFQAALRGAQDIIGASNLGGLSILGGTVPIAGIIAGVIGLVGSLLGGGSAREREQRELAERQSRTTPALTFNISVIQNNSYSGTNADPAIKADNDRRTREIVYEVFQEVGYSNLRDRALGNV